MALKPSPRFRARALSDVRDDDSRCDISDVRAVKQRVERALHNDVRALGDRRPREEHPVRAKFDTIAIDDIIEHGGERFANLPARRNT